MPTPTPSCAVSASSGAHTPGPWSVMPEEADRPYIRIRGTRLGGRYKVANVLSPNYEGALPCEAEETRANAALIAAAPDLLETLIAAEQALTHAGSHLHAERCRAVIAKATQSPSPQ